MNDLSIDTLGNISSTIPIITDWITSKNSYNSICVNSIYDPCNTITTSTCPTKLETDSNELKINIKKFQIKFNFNL